VTYSVPNYGRMIEPGPRLEAYVKALRTAIEPGSVVADIGTGTGFFAVLAAKLGADRVYAIEPGESIQVAREMARQNAVEDRITFIHGLSTEVDLDEKVDVIVSDLRGVLPVYGTHIPSLIDARQRHLKPGGSLLPRKDTVRVAVVHDPKSYREHVEPWAPDTEGLDLEPHRRRAVNDWFIQRVERGGLRTDPLTWVELDYATIESPDVDETLVWEVGRAGTSHGLSVWFDALIGPDAEFTTGPDGPELVYGSAFFPFERPLDLLAGDRLYVDFRAKLVGDDYTWIWNSRLEGVDGTDRVSFEQSTLHGAPVTAERLRQRAADFRPRLTRDGEIDAVILRRMDGHRSLAQIANEIRQKFPHDLPDAAGALTRVADLSVEYSKRSG
jgi:protein arginine N-methyltransferase 1